MSNPLYDTLFGRHANNEAVFIRRPDGSQLTYKAFIRMAARFAGALAAYGLTSGDRLAVQVKKSPEALAVYAACVQAGIIFLPLNTAYMPAEVQYFVENSGAKLMLCDDPALEGLRAVLDVELMSLNEDGTGSFVAASINHTEEFATVARTLDDLAAFLYTSGTTGRSKGAMLRQDNLLSNAAVLKDYWRFEANDVLLHALPIFHTHGLFVATNITLLAGGSMVFLPTFNTDEMIRLMPDATSMMGVPTFYTRLLDDPRFDRDLTAHMRLFISGSAPLLAETHKDFEARTGHCILERYGMTETNMNTSNPLEGDRIAGTVGRPLPGVELKITDPKSGDPLPDGDVGQIEVRGPNVFKGYWQMPEKTAEELRTDGFFITGDLGLIDVRGYVQIVGRNKDLIISGGYNIYPKEVELVLDAQPGVLESAVIGVPHPDFGEAAVGVLVRSDTRSDEDLDLEAIDMAVRAELARFKHPKRLIVVDKLPRNTMGKVQKNELRERYQRVLSEG